METEIPSTSFSTYNVTEIENVTGPMPSLVQTWTNYTLEDLNDQYFLSKVGGIIFVVILMLIGIIGNAHVLFIYSVKLKRSNHRIYIICLASVDIVTCCIGMPFVTVDLRYPLLFTVVPICKILRFLNYFMCGGSALILIVIAVDRYKKICHPFKPQMSNKTAKIACCIAIGVALCLSWPAPILYGHSTVEAETISEYFEMEINITGVQCFTEDKFKTTSYQAYFNIILILLFITSTIILVTLYGLIGRKVFKQTNKFVQTIKVSTLGGQIDYSATEKTDSSGVSVSSDIQRISNRPIGKLPTKTYTNDVGNDTKSTPHTDKNEAHKQKITFMLFIITMVFVLSFLPHLSLKTVAFLRKDFLPSLRFPELVMYNTFVWSFFINNVANPVIYGFCDNRFRTEMKRLYRHCRKTDEF